MKIVVAQRGAREHFLAARALHQRGCFSRLVVDWYAPRSALAQVLISKMGKSGASALAARAHGIPDSMVTSLWLNGLWGKWQERRATAANRLYDCYPKTDAAFASRVARLYLPEHDAFFGYSYSSLEILQSERKQGRLTVVCQTDPGPVEFKLVAEEMDRFPYLAGTPPPFPTEHYNRVRQEWKIADVIIVNSDWSRKALISEGADPSKIEILPLAFETTSYDPTQDSRRLTRVSYHIREISTDGVSVGRVTPCAPGIQPDVFIDQNRRARSDAPYLGEKCGLNPSRPLRVLWLGQVNVRKGIHYLIEAARLLEDQPVEINIVGPIQIRSEIIASAPANMRFLGSIPRGQAIEAYQDHDIFVLPTLSDGFAITQLEALAHGMPVIATPNCGQVVKEGETGFIVPPRDQIALAKAITRFVSDRKLVSTMSEHCADSAKQFSIKTYADRLMEIFERRMQIARGKGRP